MHNDKKNLRRKLTSISITHLHLALFVITVIDVFSLSKCITELVFCIIDNNIYIKEIGRRIFSINKLILTTHDSVKWTHPIYKKKNSQEIN